MSTSIILLDQNFNANNVAIMVFEPSVSINDPPPPPQLGGDRRHGPKKLIKKNKNQFEKLFIDLNTSLCIYPSKGRRWQLKKVFGIPLVMQNPF